MMKDVDESSVAAILNENDPKKTVKGEPIDFSKTPLVVEISDATSEKDKVIFKVVTKTNMPNFSGVVSTVMRQHQEFVWLHDRFEEKPMYVGFIIPPAPARPDFEASREKLYKLEQGEGTMTDDEYNAMKRELEAEYLATFKKTVVMHEMFLKRLASHPVFRNDETFRVFLEYNDDLWIRGKNKMEKIESFMSSVSATTDEYLLSAKVKDISEFFEQEKIFLISYHSHLKDATGKADKMTRKHKDVANCYLKIVTGLIQLSIIDHKDLEKFLKRVADCFEKARTVEARVASDEDLKLTDTLRFYMRDSFAAKRLLYRRLRCLADYENANRNLEKVRTKNKDVHAAAEVIEAEAAQQKACDLFEQMSDKAREELTNFKARRIADFRKYLIELAELEIMHAKTQVKLLKDCLSSVREV